MNGINAAAKLTGTLPRYGHKFVSLPKQTATETFTLASIKADMVSKEFSQVSPESTSNMDEAYLTVKARRALLSTLSRSGMNG